MPAEYQTFLTASTQAAAALIGLLFVSISLAPERVFGAESEARRQAQALSAFTALTNVFFISFASLIPEVAIGIVVLVVALVSTSQSLSLLFALKDWRQERALLRGATLLAVSLVIYGSEVDIGVQLLRSPNSRGALSSLLGILLGTFLLGLARAWELLGAPGGRFLLIGGLGRLLRALMRRGDERRE